MSTEAPPPAPNAPAPSGKPADKKILAGILGILLGAWGIHKFILGYTAEGAIMLGVTLGGILLSCLTFGLTGLAPAAMAVIGLVEGIIYLTKSDEEFVETYVNNKKGWF